MSVIGNWQQVDRTRNAKGAELSNTVKNIFIVKCNIPLKIIHGIKLILNPQDWEFLHLNLMTSTLK